MDIDKRIKQALEEESSKFNPNMADQPGLFGLVAQSFQGSMGRWVVAVNIVTLIATGFLLWCGYHFFVSSETNDLIFWGVCFVVSLQAQIALKQWLWQEMNRNNLIREVKRLEFEISQLRTKE